MIYKDFNSKKKNLKRVLDFQTPNFHESNETTCTVWYNKDSGVIRAVDTFYTKGIPVVSVVLKYSNGMAEPVLAEPERVKMTNTLQKVLDKVRDYRERKLSKLELAENLEK